MCPIGRSTTWEGATPETFTSHDATDGVNLSENDQLEMQLSQAQEGPFLGRQIVKKTIFNWMPKKMHEENSSFTPAVREHFRNGIDPSGAMTSRDEEL